jgi:hypothetical protein
MMAEVYLTYIAMSALGCMEHAIDSWFGSLCVYLMAFEVLRSRSIISDSYEHK